MDRIYEKALTIYKKTKTYREAVKVLGEETTISVFKADLDWKPSETRYSDSMAIRRNTIKTLDGATVNLILADDMYREARRCKEEAEKEGA